MAEYTLHCFARSGNAAMRAPVFRAPAGPQFAMLGAQRSPFIAG
jgi:hypothetical protein